MISASEADEQRAVIEYCRWKHPDVLIFHIPNGGSRDAREAHNLKLQGVVAGVPDLCIPVAKRGYHGMYIEMKRAGKGARITENQKEIIAYLRDQGYRAEICYGATEAIRAIDHYLGEKS